MDIKRKTLEKRKYIRKKAEEDLRKLRENEDEKTKNGNTYKIECLKKQCVCVKKKDYDEATTIDAKTSILSEMENVSQQDLKKKRIAGKCPNATRQMNP